jgi:hypothetical protein
MWLSILLVLAPVANLDSMPIRVEKPRICDARTDSSADGAWSLRIEPERIDGQGVTRYRLTHSGSDAWSASHPVFLDQAFVSATGTVVGYGWTSTTKQSPGGEYHVLILAADGTVLRDEVSPSLVRMRSNDPAPDKTGAIVAITGLLVIEERDLVLVRCRDDGPKGEEWRRFRISTGEALDRIRPRTQIPKADDFRSVMASQVVPGTPLILTQWWDFLPGTHWGFRYVLCDADANVMWQLELPRDLSDYAGDSHDMMDEIQAAPMAGILSLADGRFELQMCAESRRVTFEVARAGDKSWTVREVERKELVSKPAPTRETALPTPSAEKAPPVEPLGVIDLTADDPPRSEARYVQGFSFDDHGRIVLVRRVRPTDEFDLVRMNADGTEAVVRRLEKRTTTQEWWSGRACWTHDDKVIAVWSRGSHFYGLAEVSLVDAGVRDLPISFEYNEPRLERTPSGGFVALGGGALQAFERDGKPLWKRTAKNGLCGGREFTTDPDGRITILDDPPRGGPAFQHIRADGEVGAYESLTEAPRGLCDEFCVNLAGGWVLWTRTGLVLVDETLVCRKPVPVLDRASRPLYVSSVRTAPDGSTWVSSRGSLFRFGPKLELDRTLGDAADDDALRTASAVHVDSGGKIHALAELTAAVFVLDDAGHRKRFFRPLDEDFQNGVDPYDVRLDIRGDGSVSVGSAVAGYVDFDADGKRVGRRANTSKDILIEQAGTGLSWKVADDVCLVNSDGEVVHRADKRSDGAWLMSSGDGAVADDGTLATYIRVGARSNPGMAIATFDRKGDLAHTCLIDSDEAGMLAWDGRRAAYLTTGKLHFVDVATGAQKVMEIAPGGFPARDTCRLFFVHEGREVWVFDRYTRIYRYATPRFD